MVKTLKGKSPILSQVGCTEKELVAALKKSKTFRGLTFIELILDRTDCSKALPRWGTAVADYNASQGEDEPTELDLIRYISMLKTLVPAGVR